jgi:P-type E1-E2 ATPase
MLVMGDRLRPDAADLVAALHTEGVHNVAMVTGDRRDVALAVASQAGLDRVYPEQSPEDKLALVRAAREQPDRRPVVMVGDGVNDAPADVGIALADVGIALAGNSRTVSSEAADARRGSTLPSSSTRCARCVVESRALRPPGVHVDRWLG